MTGPVVVEADGASRGNPGPAAYGVVLRDAETGRVIAEKGAAIGIATNNVAEYSGLLAGLELAAEHAPGAVVEVRLDSQLVVEQMSGRWKIKHPDLRSLAETAGRLAPDGTTYTWVPRAENSHADRLANEALDGRPTDAPADDAGPGGEAGSIQEQTRSRGWSPSGTATTLVLVRHGVTVHTVDKRFSGGLGGGNPGLSDEGRDQVRATAQWLAPMADDIDLLITSPVRRTVETAEIVGEFLGREPEVEPGFAEMEFGAWDGMTFAEVSEQHADDLDAWLGSLDHEPGGGESFRSVEKRVIEARDRLLASHSGRTVVVVSHVTPIKTLVADALGAPLDSLYRMELAPASVSVVSYFEGGPERPGTIGSMRLFNARPVETAFLPR